MNRVLLGACAFLCLAGGTYCLWLLGDCSRRLLPGGGRRDRRKSRSLPQQVDWVCQAVAAGAFLLVAGVLLVAILRRERPALDRREETGPEPALVRKVPEVPGVTATRLFAAGAEPGQPIVGADLVGLPLTNADLHALACQLPQLEWLNLTGTEIDDQGLDHLASLNRLECLALSETRISDRGIARLLVHENLEELDLDGTLVTDVGLRMVGRIAGLRKLDLQRTAVTDAGLKALEDLENLEYLNVLQTDVSAQAVEELISRLPRLTHVKQERRH